MTPDDLIAELATRHGIKISAKDPVLAVAFLNDLILSDQLDRARGLMDEQFRGFTRELTGHRKALEGEVGKLLDAADGELGRRIAAAVAGGLDGATRDARERMASTIEGGRTQAEAAIAHLVDEAQQAAREAAHARLWAVCAAGIAGVIAVALVVYAGMPLFARMI